MFIVLEVIMVLCGLACIIMGGIHFRRLPRVSSILIIGAGIVLFLFGVGRFFDFYTLPDGSDRTFPAKHRNPAYESPVDEGYPWNDKYRLYRT